MVKRRIAVTCTTVPGGNSHVFKLVGLRIPWNSSLSFGTTARLYDLGGSLEGNLQGMIVNGQWIFLCRMLVAQILRVNIPERSAVLPIQSEVLMRLVFAKI